MTAPIRTPGRVTVPTVTLAHGGGGKAMKDLIDDVFVGAFANPLLAPLEDQARIDLAALAATGDRLAFTTDAYVVDPLFFPGGDIGRLAVCGTVNDLAVGGAAPLYLSAAFVIEEGLPIDLLREVTASMAGAAHEAGLVIATGDTKVVPKGACDKLFITTSGIGVIRPGIELRVDRARPGDVVLVNGWLGDHGAAILAARGDLALDTPIESDCAPLHRLIAALLEAAPGTRCLRDATRGGVATVLNEFAHASCVAIEIDERRTKLREPVKGFCEILGLDPLYLANEGKIVAIVLQEEADAALGAMRRDPLGRDAAVIGRVHGREPGRQPAGRRRFAYGSTVDMHELALTCSIVETADEAAAGRRVARVTLVIGKLSGVMVEAIRFCFDEVARGTALDGAALDIIEPEGRARCDECGAEFVMPDLLTHCRCGSFALTRLQSEELTIKSIELEEAV